MTAPRRVGAETSKTRAAILDATERMMLHEGYGAVTSRRVAIEVGVTAPLVHYYFPSLDDLFLAVLKRRTEEFLARQDSMLSGDDPLRALWDFSFEAASVMFTTEMIAVANHRDAIKVELARYVEEFRRAQVNAIKNAQAEGRVDLRGLPVAGVVAILTNAARGIAMERALGASGSTRDANAVITTLLEQLRAAPAPRRGRKAPLSR